MLLEWVLFTGFVRPDVAFWLTLLLLTTTAMVNTIYEKCYRKAVTEKLNKLKTSHRSFSLRELALG